MEGYLSHKFNINGNEVEISFFIGVYSLEKCLEEMDASLSDLAMLLNKKFMPMVRLYMYYSAEYQAMKTGQPFPYSKTDVYEWIDGSGGTDGEFYGKFTKSLLISLGVSTKESLEPQTEKKSPTKVKPKK